MYLNRDLDTAHAQIAHLLKGTFVDPEDLTDDAYQVVGVLPPAEYPLGEHARLVPWATCQAIAAASHDGRLDGVRARSAATPRGTGQKLAWWTGRHTPAVAGRRTDYGQWRSPAVNALRGLFTDPKW